MLDYSKNASAMAYLNMQAFLASNPENFVSAGGNYLPDYSPGITCAEVDQYMGIIDKNLAFWIPLQPNDTTGDVTRLIAFLNGKRVGYLQAQNGVCKANSGPAPEVVPVPGINQNGGTTAVNSGIPSTGSPAAPSGGSANPSGQTPAAAKGLSKTLIWVLVGVGVVSVVAIIWSVSSKK